MSTSGDLTSALAALARAGIAFTSDIEADGSKFYIIDSVQLSEDEVKMLHERGALSPDGIRHYLVDRAA